MDQVDACSGAFNRLASRPGSTLDLGWLDTTEDPSHWIRAPHWANDAEAKVAPDDVRFAPVRQSIRIEMSSAGTCAAVSKLRLP
jgi:hypothetical protein